MLEKCIANCLLCGKCASRNFIILDDFPVDNGDFTASELRQGYGIAIDIGTTTVVMALIDLIPAKIIARHSFLNPQRVYGADVISRIHAANEGHLTDLHRLITESVSSGINALLQKRSVNNIDDIVIAGNTTMIHLLLGQPCKDLGVFPFKTNVLIKEKYTYSEIFPGLQSDNFDNCKVKLIPWFAAFVGGDITAGLLFIMRRRSSHLNESSFLLIDLGTNGEIALLKNGKLTVTSCAAGPAFENSDKGNAVGASGVIHELAQLIRGGMLDETGVIKKDISGGAACGTPGFFSQKNIRSLQLAKSAVRTGVEILLDTACMTYNDIDAVYLSGGIGQAVDVSDAAEIGLIPAELTGKTKAAGNSSLGGAVCALLSPVSVVNDINALLSDFSEINLANHPRFNELFAENMLFNVGE